MIIRIGTLDDSRTVTEAHIEYRNMTGVRNAHPGSYRRSKDPVLQSVMDTMNRYVLRWSRRNMGDFANALTIGKQGFAVLLEKRGIRYYLNGKQQNKSMIMNTVARLVINSTMDDSPVSLFKALNKYMEIPNDVAYALENRAPYHWFRNARRVDVRLNVQMISDKKCAIELSEGIWAEITMRELDIYMNFYHHGKRGGKWAKLTPAKLWAKLMGEEPTEAQLKLMIAFLEQNRTHDIVEKRAQELMKDLCRQYPNRIKMRAFGGKRWMFVRGQKADWILRENTRKSGIQDVATYIYKTGDAIPAGAIKYQEGWLSGPICIDNATYGSSVGDQFAVRAIALMNDVITMQRVSTIRRYLDTDEPCRLDWVEICNA